MTVMDRGDPNVGAEESLLLPLSIVAVDVGWRCNELEPAGDHLHWPHHLWRRTHLSCCPASKQSYFLEHELNCFLKTFFSAFGIKQTPIYTISGSLPTREVTFNVLLSVWIAVTTTQHTIMSWKHHFKKGYANMANNFHSNDVQNDLGTKQILLLENLLLPCLDFTIYSVDPLN